MTELNVTKPTLIAWSRKSQFALQNLKTIEQDALAEQWLTSTADRVKAWGEQLRQVETTLSHRDVGELSTLQLHQLTRSLRRRIEQATGTPGFTIPINDIPANEYQEQLQDWRA